MTTRPAPALAATTRLAATQLAVADLDRALAFYQDSLGLRLHGREPRTARLGAGGEDVLVLREQAGARRAGRHAGLYHVALLYPSRLELARAVKRLIATQTPIDGLSDHGTHEAIYLPDADGNGLELAADRPRERWPSLDAYGLGPKPLDLDALLAVAADEPQPPRRVEPGLATGHLHLHVGDVDAARDFYRDVIGFDLVFQMPRAAFLSAGGYHHHVAVNEWCGHGVPPAPAGVVGLREWTIVVTPEDLRAIAARVGATAAVDDGGLALRDPSGNPVRIVAA